MVLKGYDDDNDDDDSCHSLILLCANSHVSRVHVGVMSRIFGGDFFF